MEYHIEHSLDFDKMPTKKEIAQAIKSVVTGQGKLPQETLWDDSPADDEFLRIAEAIEQRGKDA